MYNVSCPSEKPNGCCMILIGGGGYEYCGDCDLVKSWELKFTAAGFQCVNFVYRTPRPLNLPIHQSAWEDGQRAVRLVRSEAAKRGFDPEKIGTISMSAGSHLATLLATSALTPAYEKVDKIDNVPCKVQWGVGIYPAYALTDGADHGNKTRGNDDSARLVPEFAFDPDTCPMVFILGDADGYASMASVKTWEQMRRMWVMSDLHTLCKRPHCFQRKASPGTGNYTWLGRIWEFMNHKGINR